MENIREDTIFGNDNTKNDNFSIEETPSDVTQVNLK